MRHTIFRKGLIAVTALFVTSTACAQAPHDSYEALFQSAIKAITWDFHEDWAFTLTSSARTAIAWAGSTQDSRKTNAGHCSRSTVVHRRMRSQRNTPRIAAITISVTSDSEDDDGDDNAIDMVEPGTLRLIEETDDYWLLSFVPTDDDQEDDVGRKVLKSMQGTVKIIKDGEYLAYIDIHNEKPIRPKVGVKMKKFLMHMSFEPIADDGPVVMRSMDFAIKLSAFVLLRVSEAESVAFSDFEYAGESL